MKLEWDENKRLLNIKKHGIDFIGAEAIFRGATVTFEDDRFDYEEQRFITFGLFEMRTVYVAHTEHHDCIRIISIRKATKAEEKFYYENITN